MQCMLALCVVGFTSCQEFDIDSQPEAPINIQIDALDNYTVLATAPSNIVFGVSANTPWSIASDQQWCKVTPTSSAISSLVSEITVTAEPNDTPKERTAKLTVTADGVEAAKVITVVQKSKENLVVIPFDEIVASEGGKISFNIISNKPWEIIPSTQFLENIDKTKGEGDESGEKIPVTITVPANNGSIRTGEITVKTAFEETKFQITQDGVVIELEEPTETGTLDFASLEEEHTYKIRANHEWKIKSGYPDWIKAEKTSEGELKISVTQNTRLINRTAEVVLETVNPIAGFEGIPFTVNQMSGFTLNCEEGQFIIDEETGNVKIMQHKPAVIESIYKYKKGRLVIEFDEVSMANTSELKIDLGMMRLELKPGKPMGGAGSFFFNGNGLNWSRDNFETTVEAANSMKTVEFSLTNNTTDDKLTSLLKIDGEKKGGLSNKVLNGNPEFQISFAFLGSTPTDFFTIKSITYYPAE